MRYLYTLLLYLLLPLIVLRLFWRSLKAPAYAKRWAERFGYFKASADRQNGIWVHAVSLGETLAAIPLIKHLQKTYPGLPITVTTMTPTGSAQVIAQLGDSVFHVYAPYDFPDAWQRFFKKLTPRLIVVMETELWPNMLHLAASRNIPVMIANARLSERSAKGYQKVVRLTRAMLGNIRLLCAQHQSDGQRFIQLGLVPEKLMVTGSIKFDIAVPEAVSEQSRDLRASFHGRPTWIAASTHEGEEPIILKTHQQLLVEYPDLLLILVPRHPERFTVVQKLCGDFNFNVARRSQYETVDEQVQVLLGDTLGELLVLYGAADVAFVGGSFVSVGGHNILEPISLNVPTVVGPQMFNFSEITQLLLSQNGLVQIAHAEQLLVTMQTLLNEHEWRQQLASNAQYVLHQNKGALNKLMEAIASLLSC